VKFSTGEWWFADWIEPRCVPSGAAVNVDRRSLAFLTSGFRAAYLSLVSEPHQVSVMAEKFGRVPVFAGLDEAALGLLATRVRELKLAAGSLAVREGEPGNQFYAIDAGAVRVCKNFGRVDEVELARLGQGQSFGEMSIVEPLTRCATVQTVSETVLLRLSSLDFHELYKAMPAQYSVLLLNIARELSRRLRRLDGVFAALH